MVWLGSASSAGLLLPPALLNESLGMSMPFDRHTRGFSDCSVYRGLGCRETVNQNP